ncbi:MAG: hypothetical protein LBR83_03865 [Clostridiales bacterium]|jgi:hypothetical protein|nr:hypothetical protein [Clostridiales bacterium]
MKRYLRVETGKFLKDSEYDANFEAERAENHAAAYEGLLVGEEACGLFLSSEIFISRVNALLKSGKKVGVITPYLTPEREDALAKMLESLRPAEIVVNDVGALWLVRQSKHTPVIGRLLTRQQTDPVILSFYQPQPSRVVLRESECVRLEHAPPPASLTGRLTGSPVFSAASVFLSGYETMTVMMDWPPQGMMDKIPREFSVLWSIDEVLVAVLPCQGCEACPERETYIGMTRARIPVYRKRNVCYFKPAENPLITPANSSYNAFDF